MKIYCKNRLTKRSKKEFLRQYFDNGTPATYYRGNNGLQCGANRNRSIGDLKALLDGSFKTTTSINKTIILLMSLFEESKIKALKCPDIGKIVFFDRRKSYWNFTINPDRWPNISYGNSLDSAGRCFNELIKYYNENKKK